jgi:putative MATE family efflux protein
MADRDATLAPARDRLDEAAPPAAPARRSPWRSLREAFGGSEQDFTTGSLNRAVFLLALPMMVEMLGESLFAVVDAFFVARLGAEALAAVGLTEAMLEVMFGTAVGLGMATTALVARRYGEHDERAAARAAGQAILLGILISIGLGAAGVAWAGDLLRLMGASEATIATGVGYTRWIFGGMTTVVLLFVINAIFRGAGDAATAMRALWVGNGINLILDPCLILGLGPFPELGLTGAAVATTIGRGTAVLYQVMQLRRRHARLTLRAADLRPDARLMAHLLRISVGGIAQFLVSAGSWIGLMRILAGFGSGVVAGYVVAIRIVVFVVLPAWGMSNAAATLVGQNLGALRPDRAARSVWITGFYTMGFLGAVAIAFLFAGRPLAGLFTQDPQVLPVAVEALRIIGYGYVFYAWGMVMLQAFNGAGDTTTPVVVNIICFWGCELPLAWWMSHRLGLGASGCFWAIAISHSISAVIGILLFRRGRWRTRRV